MTAPRLKLIALATAALLVSAATAWAQPPAHYVTVGQAKDELFAGTEKFAQGATKVTEINLDPSTMDMVGSARGSNSGAARKLNLMVVRTYGYDKPGMYRQEDLDAFRKRLQDGTWNCSIHTRDKDRSTDICSRTAADHETNEMVIMTTAPQQLTFIHMAGKMSLSELDEASGTGRLLPRPPAPPVPPVPLVRTPPPPSPE
jgi:hypothetical protein